MDLLWGFRGNWTGGQTIWSVSLPDVPSERPLLPHPAEERKWATNKLNIKSPEIFSLKLTNFPNWLTSDSLICGPKRKASTGHYNNSTKESEMVTFLGRRWTPSLYWPCLVHNSIWARTWLVKELLMTKLGWPWAQPRLTRRPSASRMTCRPFLSVYLSTYNTKQNKFLLHPLLESTEKWLSCCSLRQKQKIKNAF